MPAPGTHWYHVTIGTLNSWLPGDPRGFRSRKHKIHSSGHHKNPPPKGEHAGLHAYSESVASKAVIIHADQRERIASKVLQTLQRHEHRALAISVGGMHVHLLAQLPAEPPAAKQLIGFVKKSASQALGPNMPARVWSRGCGLKPIRDAEHQRNTFNYIRRHEREGAFVWTFRDDIDLNTAN